MPRKATRWQCSPGEDSYHQSHNVLKCSEQTNPDSWNLPVRSGRAYLPIPAFLSQAGKAWVATPVSRGAGARGKHGNHQLCNCSRLQKVSKPDRSWMVGFKPRPLKPMWA